MGEINDIPNPPATTEAFIYPSAKNQTRIEEEHTTM